MFRHPSTTRTKEDGRRSVYLIVATGIMTGAAVSAFQFFPLIHWTVVSLVVMLFSFFAVRHAIRLIDVHDDAARRHERGIHKLVEFDKDVLFFSWDTNGTICDYAGGAISEFGLDSKDRIGQHVEAMFESSGPDAMDAYHQIYTSEHPAASYEVTETNQLTGKTDIWYIRLFTNDYPHAGYGLVRRVTHERLKASDLEARNAALQVLRQEANDRTLKLIKISEDRFYGFYADHKNVPDPLTESIHGRDVAAPLSESK